MGWPVDDQEVEALLAGTATGRDELASLQGFLREVRDPRRGPRPRPSQELAGLFSGGPAGGVFGPPPAAGPVGAAPGARRVGAAGRKPVRKMAKVAVATTTAALAVTLAAAAQILPGTQARTPISVSAPATPVRLGADQSVATGTSEVKAGAGVAVPHPPTSVSAPPATARSVGGADPNTLSGEALARLPVEVLRTLSGDTLARLPLEVLRTLPGEVLVRLPAEARNALPGEALARLPADVLRGLPAEALARLPGEVLRTLPGDALARLPLDLLRGLPVDVQLRLPAEVLRLLLLNPPPTTTTTTATGAPRP